LTLPQPIADAVEEIRREKLRGASWALYRAARAVLEAWEQGLLDCAAAGETAKAIEEANKSMAPLANLAYAIRESCRQNLPGAPAAQARRLLEYRERAQELLREASRSLDWPQTILTISYSSTVETIIHANKDAIHEVIVLESRPGGEGAILAANLRATGVNARLAPDTMTPHALQQAGTALTGADAVTRDACLVNKLGTLQLAILAEHTGKPLITAYDATKIHPKTTCETHPVEERTYMAPGYGPVRYPLFDKTPPDKITLAITEQGPQPHNPKTIETLWKQMIEYVLRG